MQLFCNLKGSVLCDNVLYGCVEIFLLSEIPGCFFSFTSMQMCLHTWSTNANRPICMAFLSGICMCSLSSDYVNVSATLQLI